MIENRGHFTFFFTLSSAEMHWPEVLVQVLRERGHHIEFLQEEWDYSYETVTVDGQLLSEFKKNIKNMSDFLKPHYVTITRMFDRRVKSFMNRILKHLPVQHFTWRVEFQSRGMPHIHGVFWIPKKDLEPYETESGEFDPEKVSELADAWISCSLNTGDEVLDDLVKDRQKHNHQRHCNRNGKCRYGFPKLPSDETIAAMPLPDTMSEQEKKIKIEEAQGILEIVRKGLIDLGKDETDIELCDFLESIGIKYDEYKDALKISNTGMTIILKRRVVERNINNYNPKILYCWRANTDIQICLDVYSVITYITGTRKIFLLFCSIIRNLCKFKIVN